MSSMLPPARTDTKTIGPVRIVDPGEPTAAKMCDIEITGSVVTAIRPTRGSSSAETYLDAEGMYAVAGRVNAHDHLYSHELRDPLPGLDLGAMRKWIDARSEHEILFTMFATAQLSMSHGVTLVRDLGAPAGLNTTLAGLLDRGLLVGPTVVPSGRAIVMTGGHVWTFGREADGPWDCRRAVREQKKAGAKVIKIMGSGGLSHYPKEDFSAQQFTDEELAAVVDEAARAGLPTCAHVFDSAAVARAISHGVDCIEHGVDIDDETLGIMAERGTYYVPTLTNMERIASREYNETAGTPERAAVLTAAVVEPHHATFRRALNAGVRIAVGTDSTGDYTEELLRMASLGMSPDQVVLAATVAGADLCREPGGRIRVGERADFSLHQTNPLDDLSVLTKPDYVFCRGALIRGKCR